MINRTRFQMDSDILKYMSILGASFYYNDNNTLELYFKIDGINCCYDYYQQGVCFEHEIISKYKDVFESRGLGDSVSGNTIIDLDGLVLLHTILKGENVDECYEKNLKDAKKQMLLNIMDETKDTSDHGQFGDIDYVTAPFLRETFDVERFLDECIFNTTGYYIGAYDKSKCIAFDWKKKDGDFNYSSFIYGPSFKNCIKYNNGSPNLNREIYHTYNINNKFDKESVTYSCGEGENTVTTVYYPADDYVEEKVYFVKVYRQAHPLDSSKMIALTNIMTSDGLSYIKKDSVTKIKKQ